jgi:HSP20 family protein
MEVFYMFGLTPYNRRNNELVSRNGMFDFRNVFDDFFSDSFLPGFFSVSNQMKADIRENEKEYVIDAEIPGVKKEDIKLELRDDTLTISVERNEQVNEERENYIRKERRYGSYSRSFYVENVKNEDVSAKYNDGILTVTLPKSKEAKEKHHRIEIQ